MWIEELSYSDHLPIVLQINTGYEAIKSPYNNEILTRKFIWTKGNVEMLKHNLSDIEDGNETDINTKTVNFTKQIYTAMESANIIKFAKRRHQLSKPWYDKDCYIMKKRTKISLQRCRNSNNLHDRQKYIEARREYFKLLQRKRYEFNKDKNEMIKNAKDPKSFWNAIAAFRKKLIIQGEIDIKEWFLFYKNLLNKENNEATFTLNQMIGWKDPDLDAEITLEEIYDVVKKLANGKAVGLDGIPNELLKNLPIPILTKLKNLFNKIINRLNNWIEKREIILENQAGFRKNRSCTDHILLLNSLIQLSLRRKRGKLYVFFVDLTKAFDTVPHDLLWQKLHKMGISNKFVMLIKNFYQEAKIIIRWKGQYSSNVKINSEVLQGESLSPLLFVLYMADLIELYNNSALTGFHLPDFGVLHLLLYEDDIAIIGESKINLQIKINLLKSYLDNNKLVLNENKSKVMVFRNGGRPARQENCVHGIPRPPETDNGPNFTSRDFKDFQKKWLFDHQTSSPLYPKSNGLAERAIQTAKNLIRKCLDSGQEVELALLNFYNTPRDGLPSLAQCLFSRRTRTLLPTSTHQLEPEIQNKHPQNLRNKREKQKTHHDKTAKMMRSFKKVERTMLKQLNGSLPKLPKK
ncbi:hypothetical protein LAZ67_X002430 [Cordylochernes scorpioides]|uniref:Reverse transcriptase domain-containing protein n=1 Tax=Cordylochernes scorpioides TaxID=51811 RepID=A0ABY6LTV9_9ARAC|nr:hypothetical protein LAZ67_X002430 [Cordylochernes scorpioides]